MTIGVHDGHDKIVTYFVQENEMRDLLKIKGTRARKPMEGSSWWGGILEGRGGKYGPEKFHRQLRPRDE